MVTEFFTPQGSRGTGSTKEGEDPVITGLIGGVPRNTAPVQGLGNIRTLDSFREDPIWMAAGLLEKMGQIRENMEEALYKSTGKLTKEKVLEEKAFEEARVALNEIQRFLVDRRDSLSGILDLNLFLLVLSGLVTEEEAVEILIKMK